MNTLQMIIYIADYMEPNRDFPGVEDLRKAAYEDLHKAMELGLHMTLQHLARQGNEVSPASQEALAWLKQNVQ
jgi:nicotinate-nucleotide adenylyltransferase